MLKVTFSALAIAGMVAALVLNLPRQWPPNTRHVKGAEAARLKPFQLPQIKSATAEFEADLASLTGRVEAVADPAKRQSLLQRLDNYAKSSQTTLTLVSNVQATVKPIEEQLAEGAQPSEVSRDVVASIAQTIEAVEQVKDERAAIEADLSPVSETTVPNENEKSFWDTVLEVLGVLLDIFKLLALLFGGGGGSDSAGASVAVDIGMGSGPTSEEIAESGLGNGGGNGFYGPLVAISGDGGDAHLVKADGDRLVVLPYHDLSKRTFLNLPPELQRSGVTLVDLKIPEATFPTVASFRGAEGGTADLRYTASDQYELLHGAF